MNKISEHIGNEIKRMRKIKGYSQQDFADMISLTRASVINIEKGRHSPTLEKIYIICKILECTPNDLFPEVTKAVIKRKTVSRVIVKEVYKYSPVK